VDGSSDTCAHTFFYIYFLDTCVVIIKFSWEVLAFFIISLDLFWDGYLDDLFCFRVIY
jgi:hypothetical protein